MYIVWAIPQPEGRKAFLPIAGLSLVFLGLFLVLLFALISSPYFWYQHRLERLLPSCLDPNRASPIKSNTASRATIKKTLTRESTWPTTSLPSKSCKACRSRRAYFPILPTFELELIRVLSGSATRLQASPEPS